ncbi:MAG: alpha/beta hydrolase [Saprospiraceae bacterium]
MAYATFQVHKNLYWVRPAEPKSVTQLNTITCPTLIILSEKDNPIIECCADQLENAIPGTERVNIAGVAHMPNMERPNEVNRVIADFIKR